jgi:general secretion pathway protein J
MRAGRAQQRGFTLIELLLAISLMALMTVLAWRGLDGMTRAQTQLRQHSDEVLALQAGLAQWSADLDALAQQPGSPSLDWDGRALRMLRRGSGTPGEGLRVVAWSRRNVDGRAQWLRWQSPTLTTRSQMQLAWQQAAQWGQNPSEAQRQLEVRIVQLDQWQIFYYRGQSWSNPLSSAGTEGGDAAPVVTPVPDAVRLVLTLSPGQAISGTLTRDWLRPNMGGVQ